METFTDTAIRPALYRALCTLTGVPEDAGPVLEGALRHARAADRAGDMTEGALADLCAVYAAARAAGFRPGNGPTGAAWVRTLDSGRCAYVYTGPFGAWPTTLDTRVHYAVWSRASHEAPAVEVYATGPLRVIDALQVPTGDVEAH